MTTTRTATLWRGVVNDATSRQPVEQARVEIAGQVALTDPNGAYVLEVERDPQPHRVRVDAPGYRPHREHVLLVGDWEQARLGFELRPLPVSAPPASHERD